MEVLKEEAKLFLGGRGFAAHILAKETPAGIDSLSPANKLIFATGPLNLLPIVGTCRYQVGAKSPLTGIYGEANSGGKWAQIFKRTGLDGLIIEDKADKLVYLLVNDEGIEIRNANELTGLGTSATEDHIKKILGKSDISIACIGPAGENKVPIACIINEKDDAAGRCGLGAVMGSKNLKAVVVQSNKKLVLNNSEKIKEWTKKLWGKVKDKGFVPKLKVYGTSSDIGALNTSGELPTKNFKSSYFSKADNISLDYSSYDFVSKGCFGCPVRCKKYIKMGNGNYCKAPEYESAAAFGSLCMVDDYDSVIEANRICNDVGIDTISTGVIVAFAMECFEYGILKQSDFDGINLTWGNGKAMCELISKIANAEGIGVLLGKGVKYSAEKIGKGSEKFAAHVKGLEIPMHTPRIKKALALSYQTSVRGACHMQSCHDQEYEISGFSTSLGINNIMSRYQVEDKAKMTMLTQNVGSLLECLVVCKLIFESSANIELCEISNLIKDTIGLEITADELMMVGERTFNLCRLLGVREGLSRKDDYLPERFTQPIIDGPEKGKYISKNVMDLLLNEYYSLREWDSNGVPKGEKLKALGLDKII
jgi:aldehyde:ferredoxin oxidoreductase